MSVSFEETGIDERLVAGAADAEWDAPTSIQRAAIPVVRRGNNVSINAAAGAGVTGAWGLGVLDRLITTDATEGTGPRALVIVATEDRAAHVAETLSRLGRHARLNVRAMGAGWNVAGAPDVLVAAVDQANEAIGAATLKLDRLSVFVIDGASAIFALSGADAAVRMMVPVPGDAQRVVVTSDLTKEIESFIEAHARRAIGVPARPADRAAGPPPTRSTLSYRVVEPNGKPSALARLLNRTRTDMPLIVARSAARATWLAREMAVRGFEVDGEAAMARVAVLDEGVTGARIAADVPTDAALLGAMDLADGIVLVEPGELAHLKSIASEAGVALQAVGGERSVRGAVGSFREQVRRAAREEDLDAQFELLAPLFDELPAVEVAAALSALLRRRTPPSAEARSGIAPPPAGKPASFVRLFVSAGSKDNIRPGDLVGAITGESSVQGDHIGRIDVRETFSVIEIDARDAERVIASLNGTTMRGRSLRVDYDRKTTPSSGPRGRPSGGGPRSPGSGPRSPGAGGGPRRGPPRR